MLYDHYQHMVLNTRCIMLDYTVTYGCYKMIESCLNVQKCIVNCFKTNEVFRRYFCYTLTVMTCVSLKWYFCSDNLQVSNLLYVDQPVGTGFSYSSDRRDIRHNEKGVSDDLYDFLQVCFSYTCLLLFVVHHELCNIFS